MRCRRAAAAGGGLEIIFRRDATIYDGRFANNGWLQETPKPMTQVCWDNPVLMSVATAKKLNLKSEDEVELDLNGRKVKGAIWITPGHPDDAVTVALGYGRAAGGQGRHGLGFSAYQLRASNAMWFADGLAVARHRRRNMGWPRRKGISRWKAAPCARGDPGRVHQDSGLCPRNGGGSAAGADAV